MSSTGAKAKPGVRTAAKPKSKVASGTTGAPKLSVKGKSSASTAPSSSTKAKTTKKAPATGTAGKAKVGAKKAGAPKKGAKLPRSFTKARDKKKLEDEELKIQKQREQSALVIQIKYRSFAAKKQEEREREKAAAFEREMEELRKQAWLAQVEMDRKEEAKRRAKMQEENRRRKEEASLRRKLLEMAYDGEVDDMEATWVKASDVFKEPAEIADGHNTTLLSEAAAGGQIDAIRYLLDKGAFPNSVGEFGRTPLWRACFLGHAEAAQALLEAGGDPRITCETGENATHVASSDQVKEVLASWDVAKTDGLVAEWERRQEAKAEEAARAKEAALQTLGGAVAEAERENDAAQKVLRTCHLELEKRITEYDVCVGESKPQALLDAALTSIKEAEGHLTAAKERAEAARAALQMAKLSLREKEQEGADEKGGDGADEFAGIMVEIKDLDDVLIKDVGSKLRDSGKPAFVIDPSSQAQTFLRYIDTNYVNALSRANMDAEKLRRSILGAIRYGKPLVLDLMDVDGVWESIQVDFDCIQKDLLQGLMDRSIVADDAYLKLVRATDGEEYEEAKFSADRIDKFHFVILTSNKFPSRELMESTYAIRVHVKGY